VAGTLHLEDRHPTQQSGEGKEHVAAETERLKAENERIRQKLGIAGSTLRQGGVASSKLGGLTKAAPAAGQYDISLQFQPV